MTHFIKLINGPMNPCPTACVPDASATEQHRQFVKMFRRKY